MGIVAIACYKPYPGKEAALRRIIKKHSSILSAENLITERPPIILAAKNGIILEIFEWKSDKAKVDAHKNPQVMIHWNKIEENSTSVKLADLAESKDVYANFKPMN